MDIALLQRQGVKLDDMLDYFSVPLSLAQVHGALAYYYDHPEDIESDISDGRRVEAEIERDRALQLSAGRKCLALFVAPSRPADWGEPPGRASA